MNLGICLREAMGIWTFNLIFKPLNYKKHVLRDLSSLMHNL